MKPGILFIFLFIALSATGQHSLEKLAFPVNTEYDEICPVFNYDENILFFTRAGSPDFNKTLMENHVNLNLTLSPRTYDNKLTKIYTAITGKYVNDVSSSSFNQDIWMVNMEEGTVHHPFSPLNNALPNSICSNFSKNNEFVVINQFPIGGGLEKGFSVTKMMENGQFSIPVPLRIKNFTKEGESVNLSMSNDRQHAFIAMAGNRGKDDMDIYLSRNALANIYSPPKKLGPEINSPYRENTPFISQDKRRLYFASNRPGGYGGMDIYYCERLDYTYANWSEPKLLGPPINSSHDDSHPYICMDENTIYFSSDRGGNSDIYRAKIYRDDLLDKPIGVNISIYNEEGELIQGEIFWGEAYKHEMTGFFRTNTGQYRYIIEDNIPMLFTAARRSLKAEMVMVDPQELKDQQIYEVDLDFILTKKSGAISEDNLTIRSTTPFFIGGGVKTTEEDEITEEIEEDINDEIFLPSGTNKTVVLKNINFVRGEPVVLKKSFPSLKKLAEVLLRNPDVHIRIEGHTDNVGVKKDLMELSWNRAEAIKEFLVEEGVDPNNLSTIGYGDSRPITSNANEQARKKNRRVEIRVINQ